MTRSISPAVTKGTYVADSQYDALDGNDTSPCPPTRRRPRPQPASI